MKIYRHISVSMDSSVLRAVQNCLFILLMLNCTLSFAFDTPLDLRKIYSETVTPKLEVPTDEVQHYSKLLSEALQNAGLTPLTPQFVLLVDRNPNVQAGILFWIDENGTGQLIGSSPVSTG
ncbi:MAG: hypothetical protein KGM99_18460, partial [Burkholderiales bacterium]|nr:hypothetical protein [Burkholderiales bacterium]